ncbi:transposable element Tc1 transposase [Trichonephila clavipes]|nr:transposable element Tc1 transposase [Trichonephila clavipes]
MPPRRNKEKFQQLTEFEREGGRIIDLREGRFSFRATGARVQRVWKQWIDEYRTIRKTSSGQRNVTSGQEDQYLLRRAVNDRTASSWQLAAHWSTATGVLMWPASIRRRLLHRGLLTRVPLYRIPSRQPIDGCVSAMGS